MQKTNKNEQGKHSVALQEILALGERQIQSISELARALDLDDSYVARILKPTLWPPSAGTFTPL